MTDVYEFIDAEYATCENAPAVTQMCAWLEVSKSGFYDWKSRPESATAKRQHKLRLLIQKAFDDSDGTYGYRRIAEQLARQGVVAGAELLCRLMRQLGLVACQPRPWRPSTTKQGQACLIRTWCTATSLRRCPAPRWSVTLPISRPGRAGRFWRPSLTARLAR